MHGAFQRITILSIGMLVGAASLAAGSKSVDLGSNTPEKAHDHPEIIGALGVGDLMPGSGQLGVTNSETDFLVQPNGNNWNVFGAQAGVGYVHYFPGALQYSENLQWFPSIEPKLNAYYLGQETFSGDVWRFNSSAFNEMTYTMSIQSVRLMADGALTIMSKKKYSLYAIGGIGNAWSYLSYSDTDNANAAPCADQGLNLGKNMHSSFAWEVGGGITYTYNPRVLLSLEYLYADLGRAETSAIGNTGTITSPHITPAQFNLNSQAILAGLHVTL